MLTSSSTYMCRRSVPPGRVDNSRPDVCSRVSAQSRIVSSSSSSGSLYISVAEAASALLVKVTAMVAAGVSHGAHQKTLHPTLAPSKGSEKELQAATAVKEALAPKAIALVAKSALTAVAMPVDWHIISSAADWFEQHSQAMTNGALLATVFISDKAAVAHAPLLERLRHSYGVGANAPVRFVFVRIGPGYQQRHLAAISATATAGLTRGNAQLTLGCVSQAEAVHGLDVALTSFLPDRVQAFPSLLLTAGPTVIDAHEDVTSVGCDDFSITTVEPWSWSAATRVGELTQLVSDWAFINDLRRSRPRGQQQRRRQVRQLPRTFAINTEEDTPLLEAIAADPRGSGRGTRARATHGDAAAAPQPKVSSAAVLLTV